LANNRTLGKEKTTEVTLVGCKRTFGFGLSIRNRAILERRKAMPIVPSNRVENSILNNLKKEERGKSLMTNDIPRYPNKPS